MNFYQILVVIATPTGIPAVKTTVSPSFILFDFNAAEMERSITSSV